MTEQPYVRRIYAAQAGRDPGQTGFLQALESLYESLAPWLEERPQCEAAALLERLGEPERTALFPVIWTDDQGRPRQSRGFHIRYTAALGPERCCLVLGPGLDLSAAKALALDVSLCRALAGLPLGGGLAGADIAPAGLSDGESRRFCDSFMAGLYPLLGREDRPGCWAGQVPRRELDYLTGAWERMEAIAGRGGRPGRAQAPMSRAQAVGAGLCRFAQCALKRRGGQRMEGQRVLISGAGPAALWAGETAARMGALPIAIGDDAGCLYAAAGLPLALLRSMIREPGLPLLLWAIRSPGVEYRPGPVLWDIPADLAFLFGGGAKLGSAAARRIVLRRPAGVFEGAFQSVTARAGRIFAEAGLYAPAIAAGAGGQVLLAETDGPADRWEADRLLRTAMEDICRTVWEESERWGRPGDLLLGARIAAVAPLADALIRKGI